MKDEQALRYERQIREAEERRRKFEAEAKAMARKESQLKRSARTHRLCTIGGMLEKYLIEPDLLDEDDVERVLKGTLGEPANQRRIEALVARKKGTTAAAPTGAE